MIFRSRGQFRGLSAIMRFLIILVYLGSFYFGVVGEGYIGWPALLGFLLGIMWIVRGVARLVVKEIDKEAEAEARLMTPVTLEEDFKSPLLQDFIDKHLSAFPSPLLEELLKKRRDSQFLKNEIDEPVSLFQSIGSVMTPKDWVAIFVALSLTFIIWGFGLSFVWYWLGTTAAA